MHLSKETLHSGGLPNIPHVHRDLETTAESLGVEQEDYSCLKLPANSRVHFGTHHDHALKTQTLKIKKTHHEDMDTQRLNLVFLFEIRPFVVTSDQSSQVQVWWPVRLSARGSRSDSCEYCTPSTSGTAHHRWDPQPAGLLHDTHHCV